MKSVIIIAIAFVLLISIPVFASSHPKWVENILAWYEEGEVSKQDVINAMEYLINQNILQESYLENKLISHDCFDDARCITGTVTKVIDGDTIKVDGQSIRFALAFAPELNEFGGDTAKEFIEEICPVGSIVLVDEDDGNTQGSFDRIIGVIYCNDMNLDEELLDSGLGILYTGYCDKSEFSGESWAQKHGCMIIDCDPSYPDFCIHSSPPDLDCGDIPQKKFTVLQPDPHRFDVDKNGIGCES